MSFDEYRAKHNVSITVTYIEVTGKCLLRFRWKNGCERCYQYEPKDKKLSVDEEKFIVERAAEDYLIGCK